MSAISLSILFVCVTKCRKSGAFSSHFVAKKEKEKLKTPNGCLSEFDTWGCLKISFF